MTEEYVFGLDIGTRNVVGTVGYMSDEGFVVEAQCNMEHQTRAMLDGQIHDINRVGATVDLVKKNLEEQLGGGVLDQVCIAAAGRVLRTITTHVEYEYENETVVTGEDLHNLDMLGIEAAGKELKEEENAKYKFYCVGYTTVKYYLNGDPFGNLVDHKADKIGQDIIVTFLPEDVVDGLYTAVGKADLQVANLTLEPIAAINVAIPENFRMLNIALIDVGAGTSDICITRDGSIIAYGMIPCAGDEMTETIVQEYLVDFATAEKIKLASTTESSCTYEDIMGISHTVPAEKVWKLTEPVVNKLATDVAAKIKELNGNKTVSAAFVVGGGGKIHGFTAKLAEQLDIVPERCALRGEEVMKNINFKGSDLEKDPLLVTPIGICLNYYQQKNNFIMLHFNGDMMKLYDNGSLTVVDAAMQAGYSAEDLFPRRGKEITFTVNGIQRMVRGVEGESAIVTINGQPASMQSALTFNCDVTLVPSTEGEAAISTIADLAEYTSADISFNVCGRRVTCPKFVEVNGAMEPSDYKIKDGDVIESRGYYTVGQLAEFMDIHIDERYEIMVNNRVATLETLCYENFSVDWTTTDGNVYLGQYDYADSYEEEMANKTAEERAAAAELKPGAGTGAFGKAFAGGAEATEDGRPGNVTDFNKAYTKLHQELKEITVTVNGEPMTLKDKSEYIFIDVFNLIDFDTNQANGRTAELLLNGEAPQFIAELKDGDDIVVRWKEKEA